MNKAENHAYDFVWDFLEGALALDSVFTRVSPCMQGPIFTRFSPCRSNSGHSVVQQIE